VSGVIKGSIIHFHRARTIVVDAGGMVTTSELGNKGLHCFPFYLIVVDVFRRLCICKMFLESWLYFALIQSFCYSFEKLFLWTGVKLLTCYICLHILFVARVPILRQALFLYSTRFRVLLKKIHRKRKEKIFFF